MFSKISVLALAALASLAQTHSWIEEIAVIDSTGAIMNSSDYVGYPRHFIPHDNSTNNDNLIYSQVLNSSTPMCDFKHSAPVQNPGWPTLAKAAPGDLLAMRWIENGHVTVRYPWQATDGGPLYVYASSTETAPTIMQAQAWTTDGKGGDGKGYLLGTGMYDDGRCYQQGGTAMEIAREAAYPLPAGLLTLPGIKDLPCQIDFQIPPTFEPGTYSLFWLWNFTAPNGPLQLYSSCADITLVAGTPQYLKSTPSYSTTWVGGASVEKYFNDLIKVAPAVPASSAPASSATPSPSASASSVAPSSASSPPPVAPTTTPAPLAPTTGMFSVLSSVPTMSSVNIASILSSEAAISSSFVSAQLSSSAASIASSSAPITTSAAPAPSSSNNGVLTLTSITTVWDVVYESAPASMSPVSVTTVTVTSTAAYSTSTNSRPALFASVPSQLAGLATLALSLPSTPSASLSLFVPIETSDSVSTSSAPASATSALLSATTSLSASSSPVPSSTSSTETPPTPTPSVSPSTAATLSSGVPTTTEASTTTTPLKTPSSTTSSAAPATSTYVDPEDSDTTQNKKRKRSAKFRL